MSRTQPGRWRSWVLAAGLFALVCPVTQAQQSPAALKNAERYLAKGDLKAAEIELRSAVRDAPQDPVLRARLAEVYLQLGDPVAAEREARAARERNADEAAYLPVFAAALLAQEKFADLRASVRPSDRIPVLESKVRAALGAAAAGAGDNDTATTLLHDAVRLDPSAAEPKVQLARFLVPTRPDEADQLISDAIASN